MSTLIFFLCKHEACTDMIVHLYFSNRLVNLFFSISSNFRIQFIDYDESLNVDK